MNTPAETVVAKALKDPAYRRRLLADPAAAVAELGLKLPAGVSLKVVEDSAAVVHLVLPPAAASGALSDGELAKVSGGVVLWTNACYGATWTQYRVC